MQNLSLNEYADIFKYQSFSDDILYDPYFIMKVSHYLDKYGLLPETAKPIYYSSRTKLAYTNAFRKDSTDDIFDFFGIGLVSNPIVKGRGKMAFQNYKGRIIRNTKEDPKLWEQVAEDYEDLVLATGNSKINIATECFESADDLTGYAIRVQSPVVDGGLYSSYGQWLKGLPSRRRYTLNKAMSVFDDHTSVTEEVNKLDLDKILDTLRLRWKDEGDYRIAAQAAIALLCANNSRARSTYVSRILDKDGNIISEYYFLRGSNDTLVAQTYVEYGDNNIDGLGLASFGKMVEYCIDNAFTMNPTCETFPFKPESIDRYKRAVASQSKHLWMMYLGDGGSAPKYNPVHGWDCIEHNISNFKDFE